MKTVIVLISLLFSLPAAGYEVIFHQGFEGEQFPPEGWYGEHIHHYSPGYMSEWCAWLDSEYFAPPTQGLNSGVDGGRLGWAGELWSPSINVSGNELYKIRFHYYLYIQDVVSGNARCVIYAEPSGAGALEYLDDEYSWNEVEIDLNTSMETESIYLYYIIAVSGDIEGGGGQLCIDNVSVIHTATAVTPTSLGRVKAAYR